jgi:hypothetical protein
MAPKCVQCAILQSELFTMQYTTKKRDLSIDHPVQYRYLTATLLEL